MVPEKKTSGIVLLSAGLGEYDRSLTVFSEDFGKLRLRAPGIRKPLAKLAGEVNLFNLVDCYIAGRTLTGAEVIDSFPKLRQNGDSLEQAFYWAGLIDQFIPLQAPETDLFDLIVSTFRRADFGQLEQQFLSLLGFSGAKPHDLKLFLSERLT